MKKLLEHMMKNNRKRRIKKSLELKKSKRKKVVSYMLSGKAIIHLIAGLMKKIYYKYIFYEIRQCFSKAFEHSGRNKEVELDLFNYETKVHLKKATGVDTSNLAAKSYLASF